MRQTNSKGMKTTALIEKGKDGRYTIYTPNLQSTIIGTGDTVSEAKADFENTMKEVLETYEETGEAIPEELINTNPSLMRQYKRGQYVSEKQASKIQEAVHKMGRELLAMRLV